MSATGINTGCAGTSVRSQRASRIPTPYCYRCELGLTYPGVGSPARALSGEMIERGARTRSVVIADRW